MRPSLALSILLLSLLLILSSTTATAQTTQPQADNSNSSHNTALLGESLFAVYGVHNNDNSGFLGGNSYGAYGRHSSGNVGFFGSNSYGAYGKHQSSGNAGFLGDSNYGAYGEHSNGSYGYLGGPGYGVSGTGNTGNVGRIGGNGETGSGVSGGHSNGNFGRLGSYQYGVYGEYNAGGTLAWAGYFKGDVRVTGTLIESSAAFKVDHPLDPANQYLVHSAVESPDMMNVYNGNAVLDADGEAVVGLPDYFDVLNRDFRYQLTAIGAPGPNLYIAEKISRNRFKIAGGAPGMEVSWQVTGIRQDPWAEANRIVVEEAKPAIERGFYLHPELYGQPTERSVEWARDPEGMREIREMPARMEAERQRMEQAHQQIEQEHQRLRQAPRQQD